MDGQPLLPPAPLHTHMLSSWHSTRMQSRTRWATQKSGLSSQAEGWDLGAAAELLGVPNRQSSSPQPQSWPPCQGTGDPPEHSLKMLFLPTRCKQISKHSEPSAARWSLALKSGNGYYITSAVLGQGWEGPSICWTESFLKAWEASTAEHQRTLDTTRPSTLICQNVNDF